MKRLTRKIRLRRIGNSLGVILPREALEALGAKAKAGERLALVGLPDGGLELRALDGRFERKLAVLRDTIKHYRNTLRELAK